MPFIQYTAFYLDSIEVPSLSIHTTGYISYDASLRFNLKIYSVGWYLYLFSFFSQLCSFKKYIKTASSTAKHFCQRPVNMTVTDRISPAQQRIPTVQMVILQPQNNMHFTERAHFP